MKAGLDVYSMTKLGNYIQEVQMGYAKFGIYRQEESQKTMTYSPQKL